MSKPKTKKQAEKPTVSCIPGRCQNCGSTERTPYVDVRTFAYSGEDETGPYTHTVWRHTTCKGCGQQRRDRFRENRL